VDPPVPIPNTEVKRPSADDTEGATLCGKYATARGLFYFLVYLYRCLFQTICVSASLLLKHTPYYNIRIRDTKLSK
jgi:hypothetical protein